MKAQFVSAKTALALVPLIVSAALSAIAKTVTSFFA
jgi:hypothetical protein